MVLSASQKSKRQPTHNSRQTTQPNLTKLNPANDNKNKKAEEENISQQQQQQH